jgi:lipoyl(octanoyl) transferase
MRRGGTNACPRYTREPTPVTGGLPNPPTPNEPGRPLAAYLLKSLDPASAEALMRRLVYEVSGGGTPAVVVFDPTAGVTIGRHGSRVHIRLGLNELAARRWPVRWVMRGGGTLLHLPGQIACFPVLPLDRLGLTAAAYVETLTTIAGELCSSFGITTSPDPDRPGVRSRGRRIASVGVAVRSGVTTFGLYVNATPDLEPYRSVDCDGDPAPMTSLLRESPTPVRPQAVRQRLVDLVAERFAFDRVSVFHQHPTLLPKPTRHAITHRH